MQNSKNRQGSGDIIAPGAELSGGTVCVSITGLTLKSRWYYPRFFWHAFRAFRQARKTPGNLHASASTINGVQHTLTVWEDRAAMAKFAYSGAHRQAVAVFPKIATGKTFSFETSTIPAWDDVPALWLARGVDYSASPARKN